VFVVVVVRRRGWRRDSEHPRCPLRYAVQARIARTEAVLELVLAVEKQRADQLEFVGPAVYAQDSLRITGKEVREASILGQGTTEVLVSKVALLYAVSAGL